MRQTILILVLSRTFDFQPKIQTFKSTEITCFLLFVEVMLLEIVVVSPPEPHVCFRNKKTVFGKSRFF